MIKSSAHHLVKQQQDQVNTSSSARLRQRHSTPIRQLDRHTHARAGCDGIF